MKKQCLCILKRYLLLFFSFFICGDLAFAQARLVLNGASINISNSANLVISNPNPNAIVRNSGLILSEGQNNNIVWKIGTTAGTYVVPFGYSGSYIPLSFTTSGAVGSGVVNFATYFTGSQNSSVLPTGVTNFNGASGADKSLFAVDRFWKIDAQGYTTKPTLSNITFTYLSIGFAAPNITSLESGLSAQRYNTSSNTWNDFAKAATVNTTNKTVTLASLSPSDLYPWWVLDYVEDRHWVGAINGNWSVASNWALTNGGTSGASIPSTYDAVLFNSTFNTNATIDVNPTIGSLSMNVGYSGTVFQGASILNLSKNVNLAGGTFSGGTGPISIAGPFNLSGTNFTSTSGILDLKDNFTFNSGNFLHNNGTVKFSGTSSIQTIGGNPTIFKDINVTNISANPGLQVISNQNLAGVLTLATNVNFDPDGPSNNTVFTVLSTADNPVSDGSIDVLPSGAQVSGKMTLQRYMALEGRNNKKIYRYVSSPVQTATIADIQNEIPITGPFTGSSTCYTCSTAQSLFYYDETITTDINGSGVADLNDGYKGFPTVSNAQSFSVGKGYAMFVRGNVLSSALWDVTGNINAANSGNIILPTTYTSSGNTLNDGWNLVGNPFPSTIDWNAGSGWTKSNLDGTIYVTDNGPGAAIIHASWNGTVGTNGGSRYIAMGQGFWVKANGSGVPSLQVNENIKSPRQPAVFFRETPPTEVLRLTLSDGIATDEAVIHFREDASAGFDSHADAWKFKNSNFNLSSIINDSSKLSINSLSSLACNSNIRLSVDDILPGHYTLSFSNLGSFQGTVFTLIDSLTMKTISIDKDIIYDFDVSADPKSYGQKRFYLKISKELNPLVIEESTSGSLTANYSTNIQWYYNGKPIKGANTSTIVPTQSGLYSIKTKIGECILSGSKEYLALGTEPAGNLGFLIFPNPSPGKFFVNIPQNIKIESVSIIDTQGKKIVDVDKKEYDRVSKYEFDLGVYPSGIYIIKIIHNQGVNYFKLIKI